MRRRGFAAVFFIVAYGLGSARAHDLWVEPGVHEVNDGEKVKVRLRVGHEDDVEEVPRKPDRIVRFVAVGPKKSVEVAGEAGDRPAGEVELTGPGTHVLVYQSNHAYIELKPRAFERYLKHEGLEGIIERRGRRSEREVPGRESYARYAKALVRVGDEDAGFARRVGLALEITPTKSPFSEGSATFRVEFRGKPLPDARVDLMRLEGLKTVDFERTNEAGEVELQVPGPGRWLVAMTHMIPAAEDVRGDWESYWATLLFAR